MYSSTVEIRVRYGETDTMGYLYYGNYALYYEVGRTDLIRTVGLTYKALEEQGIIMPVVEFRSRYLRPARYDDVVTVKTSLRTLPEGRKITFYTELYNEGGKLLNSGFVTLAFVDAMTQKSIAVPNILKERLRPYFG